MPPTTAPSPPTPLTWRLVARDDLTTGDTVAMYTLLSQHFEGVHPHTFDRDLDEKNWIVLLEDQSRQLKGFSTLHIHRAADPAGQPICVVYSGDTIVDPSAWGTPTLPRAWIHSVYKVHNEHFADLPLWWLLITSGFRTYRFLPVFWREFWPRFDAPTAPALLDHLAQSRFGDAFDASSGVVRLPAPQVLRGHLLDVPPERTTDPHVTFFLQRNPGYVDGDELACLANLSPANLTPAGRRIVYGVARATCP